MIRLTFLGTGTSQGVPVISCGCWVCRSDDSRDKRLRTSALVETGRTTLLIDAGPDFRQQMLRESVGKLDGILLTHEHKDHIAGLDDVRAFNYVTGKPVDIYAEERVQRRVKQDFDYAFSEIPTRGFPRSGCIRFCRTLRFGSATPKSFRSAAYIISCPFSDSGSAGSPT